MNPWFAIGCLTVSLAFIALGVKAFMDASLECE